LLTQFFLLEQTRLLKLDGDSIIRLHPDTLEQRSKKKFTDLQKIERLGGGWFCLVCVVFRFIPVITIPSPFASGCIGLFQHSFLQVLRRHKRYLCIRDH
jgi:hypothetical protein